MCMNSTRRDGTPLLYIRCELLLLELNRPVVRTEDTVPKGDGSMRRYFCGEELEEDGDIGAHLLLFGDAGFNKGSKSIVRFRVAPQAILTKACV